MDCRNLPESLYEILRGYAVLCPPRHLRFPADLAFAQVHDFFLSRLLLNPHFIEYPPSSEYQRVFWKWAVSNLEKMPQFDDDGIDERLYEHSISLLQPQTLGTRPPAPSFFTYIWHSDTGYEFGTLMESRTTIECGTTGMKTWRASLLLAQYLIRHPQLVRGKSVLELGCGVGFLGLVLATLQQPTVHRGRIMLTDVHPHVLRRCESNLVLPCSTSSQHPLIHTEELDWADALRDSRLPMIHRVLQKASAELIIGADVVFDPSIIPALVGTLKMALAGDATKSALIALTVRNESTIAEFLRTASEYAR
ncbi:putative methyltransferase-domain-containing protein [Cytidiella melzeri]|nr:putative methyltransferase-domain-containing protein [Cytidiella melzeri]